MRRAGRRPTSRDVVHGAPKRTRLACSRIDGSATATVADGRPLPELGSQPLALVVEPAVAARPEVPDRAGAGRGVDLGRDRRGIGGAVPIVVPAPVDQARVGQLRVGDGAEVGAQAAARCGTELVRADDHEVTRRGLLVDGVDEAGQLRSGLGRRPDAAEQPERQQHRQADGDRGKRPTGQAGRDGEHQQDQDAGRVPRGEGGTAHQAAERPQPQREQADPGERSRHGLRGPAQDESPTPGLAAAEHRQHDERREGRSEQLALEDAGAAVDVEVAAEPVQGHAEDRQRVAGASPGCAGVGHLVDEHREPRQERQAPDRDRDQQATSRPRRPGCLTATRTRNATNAATSQQRPVVREQQGRDHDRHAGPHQEARLPEARGDEEDTQDRQQRDQGVHAGFAGVADGEGRQRQQRERRPAGDGTGQPAARQPGQRQRGRRQHHGERAGGEVGIAEHAHPDLQQHGVQRAGGRRAGGRRRGRRGAGRRCWRRGPRRATGRGRRATAAPSPPRPPPPR